MISDPAADAALSALSTALLGLLEQDTTPPCADGSNAWLDDSAAVRAKVAPACDACEIRHRCHDFASTARPPIVFGIFAGRDYTATTRQTRQPTAPTGETL
jgi:adenine-specific DNA glycosylase